MSRPCETTIELACGHSVTPEQVNVMSSRSYVFSDWLLSNRGYLTKDEILLVAEAITDNWARYWESC